MEKVNPGLVDELLKGYEKPEDIIADICRGSSVR